MALSHNWVPSPRSVRGEGLCYTGEMTVIAVVNGTTRIGGDSMQIAEQSKTCTKCGQIKPLSDFHIDRAQRDSRKTACRLCTNKVKALWRSRNNELVLSQRRESYGRCRQNYLDYNRSSKRRKRWFAWKLMHSFGITVERFEELLELQAGCCAICHKPPTEANGHRNKHRLHVDHDHETGTVRGLLCNNCNAGLGYFRDSQRSLGAAIKYLQKNQETCNAGS